MDILGDRKKLMKDVQPDPSHPFYDWICFTETERIQSRQSFAPAWMNGPKQRARLKKKNEGALLQSCQLEYGFWEMAYTVEDWPVEMGAVRR